MTNSTDSAFEVEFEINFSHCYEHWENPARDSSGYIYTGVSHQLVNLTLASHKIKISQKWEIMYCLRVLANRDYYLLDGNEVAYAPD